MHNDHEFIPECLKVFHSDFLHCNTAHLNLGFLLLISKHQVNKFLIHLACKEITTTYGEKTVSLNCSHKLTFSE